MPDKEPEPAALWFEVLNEVGIIEQLSRNAFERVLPDGLSLAGFTVLNHFVRLEKREATPSQLASLQRLDALGYVTLTPNPADGRGKIVRITAKGRKAREASLAALAPQLQEIAKILPSREALDALPFLRQLRSYLDNHR